MLLHCYRSQLINKRLSTPFFALLFFANVANGEPITSAPGIIESLEKIVDIQRQQMGEVTNQIKTNPKLVANLEKVKEIKIESHFMRSILLHSERKYLELIKKNECSLLTLIDAGVLQTTDGFVKNTIMVTFKITEKDKEKTESALMTKEDFLNVYTKKKCENMGDIFSLFRDDQIGKTLKKIEVKVPHNTSDCGPIFDSWKDHLYLPYICATSHSIKMGKDASRRLLDTADTAIGDKIKLRALVERGDFLTDKLSALQIAFFESICRDLDEKEKFCSRYQPEDSWNRVINKELPDFLMEYRCREILKIDNITDKDYLTCKQRMLDENTLCYTLGINSYPSLYPHLDCHSISSALSGSKLRTAYNDCPGRIDNEGVINTHRILMHFDDKKLKSTPLTCADEATQNFAELNLSYDAKKAWPLELCYPDPATQKESCLNYIPGGDTINPKSEVRVIAKILSRMKGTDPDAVCSIASDFEFNPQLLKYKSGCFVVYDPKNCTAMNCPKRAFFDLKEIKGLVYRGQPLFDYFPTSFSNEFYSIRNLLKASRKINMKVIKNLPELKFYLSVDKETIIHGLACFEDLLPMFKRRNSINQCTPTPFIIDGVLDRKENSYVVTRLAAESVHHPRLLNWQIVFSAISNYRDLHPLQTWTLYGLRKE